MVLNKYINEEEIEKNIDDEEFDTIDDEDSESEIFIDDEEDIIEEEEDEEEDDNIINDKSKDIILSKHTLEGKHSLEYDSIFKGKKTDENQEFESSSVYFNETFQVDKSSIYWHESVDNENYIKSKKVKERVYQILNDHTDLNFTNNRRKPSKTDFNNYYYLLKTQLSEDNFTNIEIFNELAVYFSDNLFNMFKLLDNKWRNMVIKELQDHVGKQNYSKEIMNRNIYEGTEVEFKASDVEGKKILITGVVMETNYEESIFKIDSFEHIYQIHISEITKILNNTKFKNNLNKLNNIDFL